MEKREVINTKIGKVTISVRKSEKDPNQYIPITQLPKTLQDGKKGFQRRSATIQEMCHTPEEALQKGKNNLNELLKLL